MKRTAKKKSEPTTTDGAAVEVIRQETALLTRVLETVKAPTVSVGLSTYREQLIELRDSLEGERLPEDRASLLEQMQRVKLIMARRMQSIKDGRVDFKSPYFGHMRLRDSDGRMRDILLGRATHINDGVTIVDWRNAPVSQIFYTCDEGDEYEMKIAGDEVTGDVLLRRTVTIQECTLKRVATPIETWVKTPEGWLDITSNRPLLQGGAGSAARPDRSRPMLGVSDSATGDRQVRFDKHLPEIASLLDREQFQLITSPEAGILAIQGSAGSGKTTVALHRVAYLAFRHPGRFNPKSTHIIVYNRALARYISQVLPALGVEKVSVSTYDDWARQLRRRHFRGFPRRYSDDTPSVVTRFKLHSGILGLLTAACDELPNMSPEDAFAEIFTSRHWLLERFPQFAPNAFSERELATVHRWCTRQHFTRVDGEGANAGDRPSMDLEDDTLLLKMHQLMIGPLIASRKKALSYNHLVVDEVQDLSPIELSVLLGTVRRGFPVTLAGDVAQKIHERSDFQDWRQVLEALGHDDVAVSPLDVSYRSTGAIMRTAREVLGPLAPEEPLRVTREGVPVDFFQFESQGEAVTFLGDQLRRLVDDEPAANVALLARYPAQADEYYETLNRAEIPRLRRVSDQDFSFKPGIEVTEIVQAKGLEFDYVVVLDCNANVFPVNPPSRHLLHVAITRAAHQCWLISVGKPTRLVSESVSLHH